MAFDPRTFLQVSNDLKIGSSEAHYRAAIGRAYYAVFGHLRTRLSLSHVTDTSVHRKVIETLGAGSVEEFLLSKRVETLFEKRKEADYKYHLEIKKHNCQHWVDEAQKIIDKFDSIEDDDE